MVFSEWDWPSKEALEMIYNKADPERGGRERCLLVGGKEKMISGGGGVQKGQAGKKKERGKDEGRIGTGGRKGRKGRQRKERG